MSISNDDGRPVVTRRGTRPGSSWADVVFALLMRRILARCNEMLPEREEPSLAWDGICSFEPVFCREGSEIPTLRFGDMVWADDLATPLVSDSPHAMITKVTGEAGVLQDAFAEHAMELSFDPHRTAAILALRGAGSRSARGQVFGRSPAIAPCNLPVVREHYPPSQLPVVNSYRQSCQSSWLRRVQNLQGCLLWESHPLYPQRVGPAAACLHHPVSAASQLSCNHAARRPIEVCWLHGLPCSSALVGHCEGGQTVL